MCTQRTNRKHSPSVLNATKFQNPRAGLSTSKPMQGEAYGQEDGLVRSRCRNPAWTPKVGNTLAQISEKSPKNPSCSILVVVVVVCFGRGGGGGGVHTLEIQVRQVRELREAGTRLTSWGLLKLQSQLPHRFHLEVLRAQSTTCFGIV